MTLIGCHTHVNYWYSFNSRFSPFLSVPGAKLGKLLANTQPYIFISFLRSPFFLNVNIIYFLNYINILSTL